MNKIELHLMYKSETSQTYEPMTAIAFCQRNSFDITLDSDDLDERIFAMMPHDNTGRDTTIEFVDPDYHKWIEEKLMELLK